MLGIPVCSVGDADLGRRQPALVHRPVPAGRHPRRAVGDGDRGDRARSGHRRARRSDSSAISRRSRSPRSPSACSSTASSWNASSPLLVAPIIGAAVFVTLARAARPGGARRRVGDVVVAARRRDPSGRRRPASARRRWTAIRLALWIVLVGCALARAGGVARRPGHQGQRRDRLRAGLRLARGADRVGRPDLARPGRVLRDRRRDVGVRSRAAGTST